MRAVCMLSRNVKPCLERPVLIQINTHFILKSMSEWVDGCLVNCKKQGYSVATLPSLARALPFDPTPAVGWSVGMGGKGYE